MANVVVVGAQWGDEGKGKVVDIYTEFADDVVRYQGGNNAGHTLVVNVASRFRPVTHAASGGLYALAENNRPADSTLLPIKMHTLTQPPPGVGQRPNGQPLFGPLPDGKHKQWRFPLASRYVAKFQSRRSLLIWQIFGHRTDGLPKEMQTKENAQRYPQLFIDHTPSIMPPPEAVAGTYVGPDGKNIKVAPLTDEDRLTLVRWIDLGCPIDLDYNPAQPQERGYGYLLDDDPRGGLYRLVPAD